jgi:hypothetical protein
LRQWKRGFGGKWAEKTGKNGENFRVNILSKYFVEIFAKTLDVSAEKLHNKGATEAVEKIYLF